MSVVSLVLLATALGALYLGLYAVQRIKCDPAEPLVLSVVAVAVWGVGYAIELSVEQLAAAVFWANLQFVGIGLAPIGWFETTRRLLGKPRMRPLVAVVLLIIPVVTVGLAFTSSFHSLFRGDPELYQSMGMTLLDADYGWFHNYVFVPFQYLFYGLTLLLLLDSWHKAHRAFRQGYAVLMLGMVVPLAGSVLYVFHIPPFGTFNPTAVLLLVTFSVYLFVFKRRRMLDIRPIAREQVLDHLNEGIIVVDIDSHLVDYNRGAVELFPELTDRAIGKTLKEVLPNQIPLILLADGVQETGVGFEIEGRSDRRYCYATVGTITGDGETILGRSLAIQDITDYVLLMQSR